MHWLIVHLHIVLAYGYEILGGILIFYSSAVTETSMPEDRKRVAHWIMFAAIALVYAGFGIGLRYGEIQQEENAKTQADHDRQDLRGMRSSMDTRMDGILSSSQLAYLQLASLSSDLRNMRVGLTQAINKNDPYKIADLEKQAQVAQQQADKLSHELLALTMAPQVARQLRDWKGELDQKQQDLSNQEWNEADRFTEQHRGKQDLNDGLRRIVTEWQKSSNEANESYQNKLKGIVATADFLRKQMLQLIPPQLQFSEDRRQEKEFDQAKRNPEALNREDAARYLEDLAKRVPPPK